MESTLNGSNVCCRCDCWVGRRKPTVSAEGLCHRYPKTISKKHDDWCFEYVRIGKKTHMSLGEHEDPNREE